MPFTIENYMNHQLTEGAVVVVIMW